MQKLKIELGRQECEIQPLTVGQIEDILEALSRPASKQTVNREILAIALSVDHPEITADVLKKAHIGSVKKLDAEVRRVLEFGEFVEPKAKEPTAGEVTGA